MKDRVFVSAVDDKLLLVQVGQQPHIGVSELAYTIDDAVAQVRNWLKAKTTMPEFPG